MLPTVSVLQVASKLELSPTRSNAYTRDTERFLRRVDDMRKIRHTLHRDMPCYTLFARDHRTFGVFDRGCAMDGEFVYDLARFAFSWHSYPQWQKTDIVIEALRMHQVSSADLTNVHE